MQIETILIFHLNLVRRVITKKTKQQQKTKTNDKVVGRRKNPTLFSGVKISSVTMKISMGFPQKLKI
jgi:hypothetical protein